MPRRINHNVNSARGRRAILAIAVALSLHDALFAVQIDAPAEAVLANSGCASGTAAFCDLRVYQVMVESFVDGDSNHDYNAGYGTSHHKGDIRGIINSLDYIKGLGLNAIWLTPIFDSRRGEPRQSGGVDLRLDATGYYARDYFSIDPYFGTLDDARELIDTAHAKGLYVFFDGVFGHHKGNLVPSPTGKLPVSSSPGVANYNQPATVEFYKEVATYWINELGIDGWRLDQSYQVPLTAWREIRTAVEQASASRALAGEQWGTLGYMVAEDWSDANTIQNRVFGPNSNPGLYSAFDFPVRYAVVGVLAGEESGLSGRSPTVISENWAYGAHDAIYANHALPNLMLGNHDLVRFGDLLQRAGIANPGDPQYWARHRLAFMFQGAYSGPITRYYGEEIGDEVPNYANRVTSNCANLGLCDDHVARTSAKILGVTVNAEDLTTEQHDLMDFHSQVMEVRDQFPALSHGWRQHLFSDNSLYVDLKTYGEQQIVFAMNASHQAIEVQINQSIFGFSPDSGRELLTETAVAIADGFLSFELSPLSGVYILLVPILPGLSGDYNDDGIVDAADYTVWRNNVGNTVPLPNAVGLGTPISEAHYMLWKENYGLRSGSSFGLVQSVPEAPALVLGGAALILLMVGQHRCVRFYREEFQMMELQLANLFIKSGQSHFQPKDGHDVSLESCGSELGTQFRKPPCRRIQCGELQ